MVDGVVYRGGVYAGLANGEDILCRCGLAVGTRSNRPPRPLIRRRVDLAPHLHRPHLHDDWHEDGTGGDYAVVDGQVGQGVP